MDDERTRRSNLERTLEIERVNENQYSATLAHSMEQVEQNLDRSNVSLFVLNNFFEFFILI